MSSDPARKITVRKGLTDQETFERETASFEVELSHTDVEGTWQKDSIRVKPNNQWRVSTNGRVHSLTLSNLTMEDTGTIVFSAEGVRTTARLTIKGDHRRCMCPFFFFSPLHLKKSAHATGLKLMNASFFCTREVLFAIAFKALKEISEEKLLIC